MSSHWVEIIGTASFFRSWSRLSGLELDDVAISSIKDHTDVAGLTVGGKQVKKRLG